MKKEAASGFFKRMTGMENFDFPVGLASQTKVGHPCYWTYGYKYSYTLCE